MTSSTRSENARRLAKLVAKLNFKIDTSYPATSPAQRHQVDRAAPLRLVLDALIEYRCPDPHDAASITGLLLILGEVVRCNPDATVAVYRMRPRATVFRKITADGSIGNFQQGRTDLVRGGIAYPGDGFFKAADKLSLQLHSYDLKRDTQVVAKKAPLIAFHVPPDLAKEWLVQIQTGQRLWRA